MTIGELIELLKTQPSDMKVMIYDSEYGALAIDESQSGVNKGYYAYFEEKVYVLWSK